MKTEIYKVKALTCDDIKVIGYYLSDGNKSFIAGDFLSPDTCPELFEINPYTVCRNAGFTDKNGSPIYEYDLVKLEQSVGSEKYQYAYIEFNEFYKQWVLRFFTEYSGFMMLDAQVYTVCGNIRINDDDANIIFEQDKKENDRDYVIDTSYCPSIFRK